MEEVKRFARRSERRKVEEDKEVRCNVATLQGRPRFMSTMSSGSHRPSPEAPFFLFPQQLQGFGPTAVPIPAPTLVRPPPDTAAGVQRPSVAGGGQANAGKRARAGPLTVLLLRGSGFFMDCLSFPSFPPSLAASPVIKR